MNKILIDETLLSRLNDLNSQLEFCDEAGRTLGYFVPMPERDRSLYDWARQEFTDKEIEQSRREAGGLNIDEVLKGLNEG
jgi:hypothetical protein